MPSISRHLITTSDEQTWPPDGPYLFLGESCCLDSRKDFWSRMNYIIAKTSNYSEVKEKKVYSYIQDIVEILLDEIRIELNTIHNVNFPKRYWDILLGYWLQRYVALCFNRYFSIENVFNRYKIKSTIIYENLNYELATKDSSSFILACNNPLWNQLFYSEVIRFFDKCILHEHKLQVSPDAFFVSISRSKNNFITYTIKKLISQALSFFQKDSDALILNTYLPKLEEIKLNLHLRQPPLFWRQKSLSTSKVNKNTRMQFLLKTDSHIGFEKFVRQLLPKVIPICYLEGYSELRSEVKSLPWPKYPKFIFTSNNFDTDEIFKAWTAEKVTHGIPYFVGQHGNHYGTHIYVGNKNWPLRKSADNFLTWGWTDGDKKNIPSFIFKTAGVKKRCKNVHGKLLLVEVYQQAACEPFDVYSRHARYIEDQFDFVRALPKGIKKDLIVRLHQSRKQTLWREDKLWADFDPSVNIDPGILPIRKLISKSSLIVHSYDSTGILETLSLDIPTICFWRGGQRHLLNSAKPYYRLLKRAGILFDSPLQAAIAVEKYWNDIDSWWQSNEVKFARELFCENYAKYESNPAFSLKKILCNAESNYTSMNKSD